MNANKAVPNADELNSTAVSRPESDQSPFSSAEMIVSLIETLSSDSFNENEFDCESLLHFFNQPSLIVPDEWIAHWPRITRLVHQAIQRFPSLRGIDFNLEKQ